MIRLFVQKKRGVAEHAHILQAAHDTPQVDFRDPALPFPFAHQSRKDVVLFPVWLRLLRGQRNVENLVGALRQILENLLPRAPQKDRRQLILIAVEAPVADQAAVFVLRAVVVEEAERGTESAAVDELHHGEQLFQLVFEGGSREHESIAAFQLFDGARRGGGPVSDALRFIQDDEVGRQFVHVAHIFQDQFVAGKVEEFRRGIQFPPPRQQSVDYLRGKSGELFDFRFPLVFYRGRGNYQYSRNTPAAPEQFSGRQGLYRLA